MRHEAAPREAGARAGQSHDPRDPHPGPAPRRPLGLFAVPLLTVLAALAPLAVGCSAAPSRTSALPPNDIIKTAQQKLTDTCLTRQGLTPPRPGDRGRPPSPAEQQRVTHALFGAGHTELSLTLPTGYSVRAHTDGCLASAQRTLYGDQRRWFRVSTVINNLKPEAAFRKEPLSEVRTRHRGDLAEWRRLRARALINAKAHLQAGPPRAAR
ncbi:hypothetical protein ABT039_34965 [Streptomyces lasiicapitis]|uniref:Lipoprotein n=1 Tax=Streptomyces lasiicapitis TaxID=1923961 RepID=A0ABQ2LXY6_9ACTN|nr:MULTISPECIES: hypothetical protein [Streptomyces]GGO44560.1 hypothetical protein GCM10012286_31100 [Streptomyces lasiicapitis]